MYQERLGGLSELGQDSQDVWILWICRLGGMDERRVSDCERLTRVCERFLSDRGKAFFGDVWVGKLFGLVGFGPAAGREKAVWMGEGWVAAGFGARVGAGLGFGAGSWVGGYGCGGAGM